MYQSDFIRPFGPTIYQGKLTAKQIDYLQEVADTTYEARQNVGNDLAGNIRDQLGIVVDDQEPFMNIIQPHLRKFIQYEDKRTNSLLINKEPEKSQESYDNLNFNLGTGPWINYQIANEFNPVHSHSGMISAVVYINVPDVIATETYTEDTNMKCAGQIEFLHGPDVLGATGTHKIIPQTGDFLLFQAGLKHTVYPFRSDVTRTSMSFNVMGIN